MGDALPHLIAFLELLRETDPDALKRAGVHFADMQNKAILDEICKIPRRDLEK